MYDENGKKVHQRHSSTTSTFSTVSFKNEDERSRTYREQLDQLLLNLYQRQSNETALSAPTHQRTASSLARLKRRGSFQQEKVVKLELLELLRHPGVSLTEEQNKNVVDEAELHAREQVHSKLSDANSKLFNEAQHLTAPEIDRIIDTGKGAQPTLNHLITMEASSVKFNDAKQLESAMKVLSLDFETMEISDIENEMTMIELPIEAHEFVLNHSVVEIEMHKIKGTRKRRKTLSKRLTVLSAPADDDGEMTSVLAVQEGLQMSLDFVEDDISTDEVAVVETNARKQNVERIARIIVDSDFIMTDEGMDDMLSEINSEKNTVASSNLLKHVLKFELDDVKFTDVEQLTRAVKILEMDLTEMTLFELEDAIEAADVGVNGEYLLKQAKVLQSKMKIEKEMMMEMKRRKRKKKKKLKKMSESGGMGVPRHVKMHSVDEEMAMTIEEEEEGVTVGHRPAKSMDSLDLIDIDGDMTEEMMEEWVDEVTPHHNMPTSFETRVSSLSVLCWQ